MQALVEPSSPHTSVGQSSGYLGQQDPAVRPAGQAAGWPSTLVCAAAMKAPEPCCPHEIHQLHPQPGCTSHCCHTDTHLSCLSSAPGPTARTVLSGDAQNFQAGIYLAALLAGPRAAIATALVTGDVLWVPWPAGLRKGASWWKYQVGLSTEMRSSCGCSRTSCHASIFQLPTRQHCRRCCSGRSSPASSSAGQALRHI